MKNIVNKEVVNNVRTRLISLLDRRNGNWQGTMTELLAAITPNRRAENIPGSPSYLRRVVDRATPGIRRSGYRVTFTRSSDHTRTRLVSFTRAAK